MRGIVTPADGKKVETRFKAGDALAATVRGAEQNDSTAGRTIA